MEYWSDIAQRSTHNGGLLKDAHSQHTDSTIYTRAFGAYHAWRWESERLGFGSGTETWAAFEMRHERRLLLTSVYICMPLVDRVIINTRDSCHSLETRDVLPKGVENLFAIGVCPSLLPPSEPGGFEIEMKMEMETESG